MTYNDPDVPNFLRVDHVEAIVATALQPKGWSRNSSWSSPDFQHGESD